MDRYQRVEKPRPESAINENEIRITSQGLIRNYISYATSLFQNNRDKHSTEIVLKAMGQAISKTVAIAEILKKRTPGLHQDTTISSVSITDIWEPIEEGLVPLEMTRHVSMISISLSTRMLNNNSPGYQPPLHLEKQMQPKFQQPKYYNNQHQPPRQSLVQYNDDSFGQGRGRGRGRGRGWGRGGYREHGGYEGYEGHGGYANNRGYPGNQGYANNQGYENNRGYPGNQGYANNRGYPGNQGYASNQENGEWNNEWGRDGGHGGGRGRGGWGYHDTGYERGRGGGGRGYGRGRGRAGGRGRGNQVFEQKDYY